MSSQPNQIKTLIYTILFGIVIGVASGVLGTAWTSAYLSDYAVQLTKLTTPLRLSQEKPRYFPSSYKEAMERFLESSLVVVVEVFEGIPGPLGYQQSDLTHQGIVLTSDGWLVVPAKEGDVQMFKTASVRLRGQVFSILETVYDKPTGVLFVKVDAHGLPVAAFGKGRDTQIGEQVFIARGSSEVIPASLSKQVWPQSSLVSSDEPNRFMRLNQEVSIGNVVFNLNGEVIALVTSDHRVLPIEAILPALRSLLESKKILRSSLGVYYIDVSHAINLPQDLTRSNRTGALLYGATSLSRAGAGKKFGLLTSDILLSVNGESIDLEQGLDELIEQYRPGETIRLNIDRAGQSQIIEVILGEQ